MPPLLSQREYVRVAVQSDLGTAAPSGSIWRTVPIEPGTFSGTSGHEPLYDRGRRGIDAMDFGAYEGVKMSEISLSDLLRVRDTPDQPSLGAFGTFVANILASSPTYDTIKVGALTAGVAGHLLTLGNAPKYLTIEHIIPSSATSPPLYHRYKDCRVTEVGVSSEAGEGMATYNVSLIGQARDYVTVSPAPTFEEDLAPPFEGWRMSLGGVYTTLNPMLMSAEWTLTRAGEAFYSGQAVQSFKDLHLGPLEVTCSMTFDYDDDNMLADLRDQAAGKAPHPVRQGSRRCGCS